MDRSERDALDRHITGNYGEDQLRDANDDFDRPAYSVHLVDFGDRINWSLTCDNGEVATGSVETKTDDGLDIHGLAWGHAFGDANRERNRLESVEGSS